MNIEQGLGIDVQCTECKHRFNVDKEDVAYQKWMRCKENGKEVALTYFTCPECGSYHFVQIDDANTIGILREAKTLFVKLSKKRNQGKDVPQKQSEKFKKTRTHLGDARNKLVKMYTGKTFIDNEAGLTHQEVRFE